MIAYSQRDPRWGNDRLGNSQYTLANAGCLVTALASVIEHLGGKVRTPRSLNRWLTDNGGFADDARFIFDTVRPLGAELVDLILCPDTPAPLDVLRNALVEGHGVVVKVDAQPGGAVQPHWVRLLLLNENGPGQIMDPWQPPGHELSNLTRYLNRFQNIAQAILAAAIYRSCDFAQRGVDVLINDGVQAELCLYAPDSFERFSPVDNWKFGDADDAEQPAMSLSEAERACMTYLVQAWNAFVVCPVLHPDDQAEFRAAIHAAQNIVLARPARYTPDARGL